MQRKPLVNEKYPTAGEKSKTCMLNVLCTAFGLGSRRSTTPSSHPEHVTRGRRCCTSQRSANFSRRFPLQVETRNPNLLVLALSSQGTSSPTERMGKGTMALCLETETLTPGQT